MTISRATRRRIAKQRESISLLRQTKIDSLEGDLHHWRARRTECADEGTRRDCEVQISYLQNDLQRLQA